MCCPLPKGRRSLREASVMEYGWSRQRDVLAGQGQRRAQKDGQSGKKKNEADGRNRAESRNSLNERKVF